MDQILPLFSLLGTAVFAVSGALAGLRKQLDIVGVSFVATLTGVGGGTTRDLLLGDTPVGWVSNPMEIFLCIVCAIVVSLFNDALSGKRLRWLYYADAAGLALFAVLGAAKAQALGAHPFVCILLGAMSASFGGLIRDVVCNETPVFLQKEIYITAALAGATLYILLSPVVVEEIAITAGITLAFTLRLFAIIHNWSLPFPRYGAKQR